MPNIDWPFPESRTPESNREPNRNYEVSLSKAFSDLEATLDRLGVDGYRWEFDAEQRKRDNRPYERANPDDPSFVLRWQMNNEQYAVACDQYSRLRDNVRTVGHYLREKRKMESRPVATGESEFANARLPEGDDDVTPRPVPPHEVLGVSPDASPGEVRDAYRERVKEVHPDRGGSPEEFQRVRDAKEELLEA